MTRTEQTGIRDLTFSGWIRKNLPDSNTGFMVSDIDFFMYNYKTQKCIILEIKTHNGTMKEWQRRMYSLISAWIEKGIDKEWKFYGCHVIIFEGTCFSDGLCRLDGRLVDEKELVKFLSMED